VTSKLERLGLKVHPGVPAVEPPKRRRTTPDRASHRLPADQRAPAPPRSAGGRLNRNIMMPPWSLTASPAQGSWISRATPFGDGVGLLEVQ